MVDVEKLGKLVLENLEGLGASKLDALAAMQAAVILGLNELNGREATQRYLAMLLGSEIGADYRAAGSDDDRLKVAGRLGNTLAVMAAKVGAPAGHIGAALQYLIFELVARDGGSRSAWASNMLDLVQRQEESERANVGHA